MNNDELRRKLKGLDEIRKSQEVDVSILKKEQNSEILDSNTETKEEPKLLWRIDKRNILYVLIDFIFIVPLTFVSIYCTIYVHGIYGLYFLEL